MEKIITISGNAYKFSFEEFDDNVDIDRILRIDYSNLIGEIITFPVIVNRFGNMLAEMESKVAETKLNLEILEAKTKERIKQEYSSQNGGKTPSVDSLNTSVTLEKSYQALYRSYINCQKERDYIQSIFWSAKDKSNKLDKLSLSIQPGDLDEAAVERALNFTINGVKAKKSRTLIN